MKLDELADLPSFRYPERVSVRLTKEHADLMRKAIGRALEEAFGKKTG